MFSDKKRLDNFWTCNDNIKSYLTWLSEILNFKEPEDWYKLKRVDLLNNGGNHLYQNYKICDIPKILYPDYVFKSYMFGINSGNMVEYLKDFEKSKNWTCPEDWYGLRKSDIDRKINMSLTDIPKLLYSDYDFNEWQFHKTNNFWNSVDNIVRYLRWLAIRLDFKNESDWYNLTQEMLNCNYGTTLYLKYAICDIPKLLYPDYDFKKEEFYKNTKQFQVFKLVQSLYPNETVIYDDRNTILNPVTNHYLELDIYVPSRKLAIEYNGIQHYEAKECWGGEKSFKETVQRDKLKIDMCKELGIRLIIVDYLTKITDLISILK